MTGTDIAIVDSYARASLPERRQYAEMIAAAGALLSPSVARQGAAGVFLMAETGAMLGIHPVAALQGVHIIDGKPTLSANLLAALVRRAGHTLRVSTKGSWHDGTFVARAVLVRADDPSFEFVVEWTKQRAEAASLLGKRGPWQTYPEAMAKSRAITEVIREGASDVTIIPAYSPEELGASNVDESGELIVVDETKHDPSQQQSAPAQQQPASTSKPAAQEPPQAPIVDKVEMSRDWVTLVTEATSRDEVLGYYREARTLGELTTPVTIEGETHELGQWMISIGQGLAEFEAANAASEDDVVVAEIVEEGAPAVLDGTEG